MGVFIGDVVNSGALQSLEMTLRFAGARQRIIAHNVANMGTPNFRPMDVSPAAFQKQLARAIENRREEGPRASGPLLMDETSEIRIGERGEMILSPRTPGTGVLRHDRNNSDLERLMQDHAENAGVYRMASELLRSRLQQLRDAIAERV